MTLPEVYKSAGWGLLALLVLTILAWTPAAWSEDEGILVIEGAEIRGEQEQPKILYIVPWQRPGNRGGLEPNRLDLVGSGLLEPLYREEFLREVDYHERFRPEPAPAGGNADH